MKKYLKLLSALLVMVGWCQGYCSQTIAGTKSGANQIEKKANVQEEDLRNDYKFIEWCWRFERNPDCNEAPPRGEMGGNGSHRHW